MRTLIVRLGALGDAVLTLPALAHLVGAGDDVTIVGVPASWSFLPLSPQMRVEDAGSAGWRGLFSGDAPQVRGFDRAFAMVGAITVAEALARTGVQTVHVPPVKPGEAGEHAAIRLLHGVGGERMDIGATYALIAPETGGAAHDLVLHPGSGGKAKRWAAGRFADLAQRFRNPIVLLGPAEDDLVPVFDGVPVAKDWPLRRVVATLAASRGFVGNDSGVSHLASWLCPTLALFGPTDPAVWAPAGPFARVLPAGDLAQLSVDDVARQL